MLISGSDESVSHILLAVYLRPGSKIPWLRGGREGGKTDGGREERRDKESSQVIRRKIPKGWEMFR